jgi:hypothetical protein
MPEIFFIERTFSFSKKNRKYRTKLRKEDIIGRFLEI